MWQRWVWALGGVLVSIVVYFLIWGLDKEGTRQNYTDTKELAETLAEKRELEKQISDITAQGENTSSEELAQDITNLKGSLSAVSDQVTKVCDKPKSADNPPPPPPPPPPPGSFEPLGPNRWYDVQRAMYPLQQQYIAMENRYAASFSSGSASSPVGTEPITIHAHGALDEFMSLLSPPAWGSTQTDDSEACERLKTHRLISNLDTSPLLAPFARAKQRIDKQKSDKQSKVETLKARQLKLDAQLGELQSHLAESPKLIVVKYLPISMAIILAFGGLMFVAARVVPQAVIGQLVESGQLIQFPTVVILFAVILVLSLAEGLTKDHTATLLAAVAGYILGSTRNGRSGSKPKDGGGDQEPETTGAQPAKDPAP